MSVQDVLPGLPTFQRDADRVGTGVSAAGWGVAERTAQRVADGVRSRVRVAAQARLRAAVRVIPDQAKRQVSVGFDADALQAAGLNPMVPVWHEFGTEKKTANPALGNALAEARPQYLADLETALQPLLER